MYGCPHCFKIIHSKKTFERHLEDCKRDKYSCDLCDLKFNEPYLLQNHKKDHERGFPDFTKYEILDTVEDEDDETDFDTDITIEAPTLKSSLCEDLNKKPENEEICDDGRVLPGPSDITIKMEFSDEETKLHNEHDEQTVASAFLDNSVVEASNGGLSNNESSASIPEASNSATGLRSEIAPSTKKEEPFASENSINVQDSQPPDEESRTPDVEETDNADTEVKNVDKPYKCPLCDLSFDKPNSRKHHKKVVHGEPQYECAHCAEKFHYKCRLLPHLKHHFPTLHVPRKIDKTKDNDEPSPSIISNVKVQCPYCYRHFREGKIYDNHIYHCGPRDCEICNRKFDRYHKLTYHVKKFHREMRLHCPTCPKIYIDKKDFKLHAACCAKRQFRCDICRLKFGKKIQMDCHKSLMHRFVAHRKPTKLFEESVGKVLLEDPNINLKTELVLEETTLQPQDVELSYPPTITEGPKKRFPCPICKSEYPSQSGMQYHKRSHYVPRFKCPHCGKWFHIKSRLLKHIGVHYRAYRPRAYGLRRSTAIQLCKVCDLPFPTKQKRRHHTITQHREPQFKCSKCERQFYYKHILRKHELIHLQNELGYLSPQEKRPPKDPVATRKQSRRFACNVCPKVFYKRVTLFTHLNYHKKTQQKHLEQLSSIDPKKIKLCKVCNLPFPTIQKRRHHMITQHREPQFKCTKCDKQFYYGNILRKHELIHLKHELGYLPPQEKRPPNDPVATRTCQECNLLFPSYKKKYHHMVTAHAEPKYTCKYCSKKFYYPTCLARHQKIHENHKKRKIKQQPQQTFLCSHCPQVFTFKHSMLSHEEVMHSAPAILPESNSESTTGSMPSSASPTRTEKNNAQPDDNEPLPTEVEHVTSRAKRHKKSMHSARGERSSSASPSEDGSAQSSDNEEENGSLNDEDSRTARAKNTRPIVYTCKDCGEQFATSKESYYHTLEKHRETLFKCSRCPSAFIAQQNLARHEQEAHKNLLPKSVADKTCLKCGLQFPSKAIKFRHMTVEHGATLFKCSQCPKIFIHRHSLTRHEKTLHKQQEQSLPKPADSTLCSEADRAEIKTIVYETRTVEKKLSIDENTKEIRTGEIEIFDTIAEDTEIGEQKTDEGTIEIKTEEVDILDTIDSSTTQKCSKCGFQFYNRGDKFRHMMVEHAATLFKCSKCAKLFLYKNSATRHERSAHGQLLESHPESADSTLCPGEDNAEIEAIVNATADKLNDETNLYGNEANENVTYALELASTEQKANDIKTEEKKTENKTYESEFDENKAEEHTSEVNEADEVNTDENTMETEIETSNTSSTENIKKDIITDETDAGENRIDYGAVDVEMSDIVKQEQVTEPFTTDETYVDEMEFETDEAVLSNTVNEVHQTEDIATIETNEFDEMEIKTEVIEISDTVVSTIAEFDEQNALNCYMCGLEFSTSEEIHNHMLEEHPDAVLTCPQCPNTFIDRQDLLRHKKSHTKQTKQTQFQPNRETQLKTCQKCGLELSSRSKKYFHMVAQHRELLFKCTKCPKLFITDSRRICHEKLPHTKLRYSNNVFPKFASVKPCTICGHQFDTPGKRERHMIVAHTDPKFICYVCSKAFYYKYELRRHLSSHKNQTIPLQGKQNIATRNIIKKSNENTAARNVAEESKSVERGVDGNEADQNAFEEIEIDYNVADVSTANVNDVNEKKTDDSVAEGNEVTNSQATSEMEVNSKLSQNV